MQARQSDSSTLDLSLIIKISQWLNPNEVGYLLCINRHFASVLNHASFWQARFGAIHFTQFSARHKALTHPKVIRAFNRGYLTLDKALLTQAQLNVTPDERIAEILPEKQITTHQERSYTRFCLRDHAIIALNAGLVSVDQLFVTWYQYIINQDLVGLDFLRTVLAKCSDRQTISTIISIIGSYSIKTHHAFIALNENLINCDQMAALKEETSKLFELLSDDGIEALRNKIITPEYFLKMRDKTKFKDWLLIAENEYLYKKLVEKFGDDITIDRMSKNSSAKQFRFSLCNDAADRQNIICFGDALKKQGLNLVIVKYKASLITCRLYFDNTRSVIDALNTMPTYEEPTQSIAPPKMG